MKSVSASCVMRHASRSKDYFLCILCAILLIFSFPNFNLWFLAWAGFVPLFFSLRNKSKGRAFLLSYLTGIIFWSGTIYWLVHVTLAGTILIILYLALYFGIFGFIISYYLLPTTYYLLFIPSLWVLLEYLRSHLFTGFPWALLGYSQYLNLPIIQIADITGSWGVSFLVMMVNAVIYSVIGYRLSVIGRIKKSLVPALCIIFVLFYGYYKIYRTPNTERRTPIKISVIQGNIPQELKWDVRAEEFIMDKYIKLTVEAARDQPHLIVWPEAALPAVLGEEKPLFFERVKDLARETKIPLLFGAVTTKNNLYYNSALLISGQAEVLGCYDKLHLVPFGEYIPFRKILTFLETIVPIGDFASGKEYTLFEIQNRFAVLICFEDIFPELAQRFVKKGAYFLVNITNDAWFGKTSAAYQHLQASVFRTVENRVFLLRAANTGISGFIAPSGEIISKVSDEFGRNIFIDGYNTQEIKIPERHLSFYTRYGDIFVVVCFLFVLYSIILSFKNKQ